MKGINIQSWSDQSRYKHPLVRDRRPTGEAPPFVWPWIPFGSERRRC